MRILFMGTPAFSVPTLKRLVADGHDVAAVYTRAPAASGRRSLRIEPSAVHAAAQEMGLPVRTPRNFRDADAVDTLQRDHADAIVVVAYGVILPPEVLAAPKFGCWNLHASLLPRWRGAAPIQRAIWAGDAETGACVMRMESGLDTGPVALTWRTPIAPSDTAHDLTARLAEHGAALMAEGFAMLAKGPVDLLRQDDSGATYAKKIDKAEAEIDWRHDAESLRRQIHALSPMPGAYSVLRIGDADERVKILRAEKLDGEGAPGTLIGDDMTVACGKGALRILLAQRAGRTSVSGRELMAGARLSLGQKFGATAG